MVANCRFARGFRISGARLVLLPDTGHMPRLETPEQPRSDRAALETAAIHTMDSETPR
jgi:hypothetical protein